MFRRIPRLSHRRYGTPVSAIDIIPDTSTCTSCEPTRSGADDRLAASIHPGLRAYHLLTGGVCQWPRILRCDKAVSKSLFSCHVKIQRRPPKLQNRISAQRVHTASQSSCTSGPVMCIRTFLSGPMKASRWGCASSEQSRPDSELLTSPWKRRVLVDCDLLRSRGLHRRSRCGPSGKRRHQRS